MARVKYFECRIYLEGGICYSGKGMTAVAAEKDALRIVGEKLGKGKKPKLSDFQHETLEWYGPKPRTLGGER